MHEGHNTQPREIAAHALQNFATQRDVVRQEVYLAVLRLRYSTPSTHCYVCLFSQALPHLPQSSLK